MFLVTSAASPVLLLQKRSSHQQPPMQLRKLGYDFLLILITCSFADAQGHQEHRPHEKRIYKPNYVATYSRSTPFLEENQFPKPVFGIAHGRPYVEAKSQKNKPTEPFKRIKHSQENQPNHEEASRDSVLPEQPSNEFKLSTEEHFPRKERMKLGQTIGMGNPEFPDASGSAEENATPEQVWPEWPEFGNHRLIEEPQAPLRRHSSEEERPFRPPESQQAGHSEEHVASPPSMRPHRLHPPNEPGLNLRPHHTSSSGVYATPLQRIHRPHPPHKPAASPRPHQKGSSGEYLVPPQQPHRPHLPNQHGAREPGDGSDSKRMAGKRFEDTGEMNRRNEPREERPTPSQRPVMRLARPGNQMHEKIVGVDMQMTAGMYSPVPEQRSREQENSHGRFSPLSGPFPEREKDERLREEHKKRNYDNEHEPKEGPAPKLSYSSPWAQNVKTEKREKNGNMDEMGDGFASKRTREGSLDAYFLKQKANEKDRPEENPKNSDQVSLQNGQLSVPQKKRPDDNRSHEKELREDSGELSNLSTENSEQSSEPGMLEDRILPHRQVNITTGTDKDESSKKRPSGKDSLKEESNPGNSPIELGNDSEKSQNERRPLAYENEKEDQHFTARQHRCTNCVPKSIDDNPSVPETVFASLPRKYLKSDAPPESLIPPNSSNFHDSRKNDSVDVGNGTWPRVPSSTTPLSTTIRFPGWIMTSTASESVTVNRTAIDH